MSRRQRGLDNEILRLAIPSILANITVPLVGLVDMAIAGHLDTAGSLSAASLIGGIAVGSMLFDLLYWNFGFLRVGTGGLTAQAFGKGDMRESSEILARALYLSLACGVFLIAVQWLFVKTAFLVVDCSPEAEMLASRYFFIRIWAAPATLSLMAFKGWFIGMQDGVSPMLTDLTVNIMNVAASLLLARGAGGWPGIGFDGIAWGTVAAQYTGLACACLLLFLRYKDRIGGSCRVLKPVSLFRGTGRFFSMNLDLFVRSLCFIVVYIGFTVFAAGYGDVALASASVLMKLMMLFSYFTDGFAYAGEALTGKYIGKKDLGSLRGTVRRIFVWSMSIGALSMIAYAFGTVPMLHVMTSDPDVIEMASRYIPWIVLMPLAGCAAFTWDGIYIGAVAARPMRNSMLWATAVFFVCCYGFLVLSGNIHTAQADAALALHGLFFGYLAHLAARAAVLSAGYRKKILGIMCCTGSSGSCK